MHYSKKCQEVIKDGYAILAREHPIAEIKISCVDIYGKEHSIRYKVTLNLNYTFEKIYDVDEEAVSFGFKSISSNDRKSEHSLKRKMRNGS